LRQVPDTKFPPPRLQPPPPFFIAIKRSIASLATSQKSSERIKLTAELFFVTSETLQTYYVSAGYKAKRRHVLTSNCSVNRRDAVLQSNKINNKQKTTIRHNCRVFFVSLLPSLLVQGTEIKWKGTSHGDDPAKTAPKSQRYWDEHNIARPDYAKTDAEIAMERGDTNYTAIAFVILLLTMGVFYFFRMKHNGQRLGGTNGIVSPFSQRMDEERAREARLARFENQSKSD
jgi:hypothetical protein